MKITSEAIVAVKKNRRCINKLGYDFNVHTRTIERDIEENEDGGRLTRPLAVDTISAETGLSRNQILTH